MNTTKLIINGLASIAVFTAAIGAPLSFLACSGTQEMTLRDRIKTELHNNLGVLSDSTYDEALDCGFISSDGRIDLSDLVEDDRDIDEGNRYQGIIKTGRK